jgi:peptidyl-prolyl cis-trans isomerase SurA
MAYIRTLKLFILTALLVVTAASVNAEIINRIYANVGDKIITQFEIESLNPKRLTMIYKKYEGAERQAELDKFYAENLEALIDNYIIEIAASREGVRVSDREVDKAVDDIMERNGVTQDRLEELLEASMKTLEQYKWQIKIDILKSRLMGSVFRPKIVVTEEEINNYIADHADDLELSDMYELRVIKVSDKEKLEQAMFDYETNKSFRDTAMKFSEDATASNGGYLGWVEVAFLDESIKEAVKGKQGITEPVSDGEGYRVFFVEGFRNKNEVNEDKKEKIINIISKERAQDIFDNWLKEKRGEILIQKRYAN